jgi:hypothetical protein
MTVNDKAILVFKKSFFSLKTFSGSLHVKKCVNEIEGAERRERERERETLA